MKFSNRTVGKILAIVWVSGFSLASAEEPVTEPSPAAADGRGRPRRREVRETEGTIAAGRFEAETILKSQYHLNGQQLEVDPD